MVHHPGFEARPQVPPHLPTRSTKAAVTAWLRPFIEGFLGYLSVLYGLIRASKDKAIRD